MNGINDNNWDTNPLVLELGNGKAQNLEMRADIFERIEHIAEHLGRKEKNYRYCIAIFCRLLIYMCWFSRFLFRSSIGNVVEVRTFERGGSRGCEGAICPGSWWMSWKNTQMRRATPLSNSSIAYAYTIGFV